PAGDAGGELPGGRGRERRNASAAGRAGLFGEAFHVVDHDVRAESYSAPGCRDRTKIAEDTGYGRPIRRDGAGIDPAAPIPDNPRPLGRLGGRSMVGQLALDQ